MSTTTDNRTLTDCGCCEGAELEYPEPYNPAGQSALRYRLARHSDFLERMVANLSRDQLPADEEITDRRPLARLTTRGEDDPTIALFDAWAVVGDVLTFYQERIANEGFLRTATERRSVLELARAIGYELNPGVAASTFLAFTADDAPGSPESATVPVRTQVQSLPGKDELPQTFETIEEITARAEWNALTPYTPQIVVEDVEGLLVLRGDLMVPGTSTLRLDGVNTGLEVGDTLLIVGPQRAQNSASAQWDITTVREVEALEDEGYTRVSLTSDLTQDYSGGPAPQVYALPLQASAFGFNAPDWQSLDTSIKQDYLPSGRDTAVSADGGTAVTGNADGTLTVWSIESNSAWTTETVLTHSLNVAITSVGISGDGQKIIAGNAGGVVKLWTYTPAGSSGTWKLTSTFTADPENPNHKSQVTFAAFSEDANEALTQGGETRYWNIQDPENPALIEERTFSSALVSGDQLTRVAGTVEGTITVWYQGQEIATLTSSDPAHKGPITHVTVSQDGKTILSGNTDGLVKLWRTLTVGDWSTYSEDPLPAAGVPAHDGPITEVALATDVTRALSRGADNRTRWWSLDTAPSAAVSADGQTSVVLDIDGIPTVWVQGNAVVTLTSTDPAHTGSVTRVAISADGQRIVTANTNLLVKIWTPDTTGSWSFPVEYSLPAAGVPAHTGSVDLLTLSDDGSQVLSRGGETKYWDIQDPAVPKLIEERTFSDALISDDEQTQIAGNADGTITVWYEGQAPEILTSSDPAHTGPVTHVAVSPDGTTIISGNVDGLVKLWRTDTPGGWAAVAEEDPLPAVGVPAHAGPISEVALATGAGTPRALSQGADNRALLWHLDTAPSTAVSADGQTSVVLDVNGIPTVWYQGQAMATLTNAGAVTRVAISADGQRIVTANVDRVLKLWIPGPTAGWSAPLEYPLPTAGVPAHTGPVDLLALTGDGSRLLSRGGETKYWDIQDPAAPNLIEEHTFSDALVSAGPEQHTQVAGTAEGTIRVWYQGTEIASLQSADPAHTRPVTHVAVSPDGLTIISGNVDGLVKLWRTDSPGGWATVAEEDPLPAMGVAAHAGPITEVALATDASTPRALSQGADNRARLWNLDAAPSTALDTFCGSAVIDAFPGTVLLDAFSDRVVIETFRDTALIEAFSVNTLINTFPVATADAIEEWPDFDFDSNPVDLDSVYSDVLSNSWIVLEQAGLIKPYKVTGVETAWRTDFTLSAQVTRLTLDTDSDLVHFDRRTTAVLAQSEALALYTPWPVPVEGSEIELSQLVPNLEPQSQAVVTGKRMRARITEKVGVEGSKLVSEDTFFDVDILEDDVLTVMSQPVAVSPPGRLIWVPQDGGYNAWIEDESGTLKSGTVRWHLRDRNGFVGFVDADVDAAIDGNQAQVILEPALEEDESVSEVVLIAAVAESDDRKRTVLILDENLANIYDHGSVALNANVAAATHGETTANEVLGSGDGASINQEFVLNKNPLTYVSAATPSGGESTLEVRVNGVLWDEAASLYPLDRRSQAYTVRHDNESNTFITFGDGKRGARLPTGEENIVATYRTGIGLDGEVGSGRLQLMQTRPLGVREVTNPVAATGSASPERLEDARANAPRTVLTLDRIVSIQDYEDFATTFAGIGKAQGAALWTGERNIAHLTVATASGEPVPRTSNLYNSLVQAIDAVRDNTTPVQVDGYKPAYFSVEAEILRDTRYRPEDVEIAIKDALLKAFSFESRDFGQDVFESEVLEVIQTVEGVIAVNLSNFYKDEKPEFAKVPVSLQARSASWDPVLQTAELAELLLINPGLDGVILKETLS